MTTLALELTEQEYTDLCARQCTGRSAMVSVPRASFGRLLRDHGRTLGAAEKRVTVIKASEQGKAECRTPASASDRRSSSSSRSAAPSGAARG